MYEYCSDTLKKEMDKGRAEETKQIEDETKRMLENRTKEKEEEKVPLISKEEKKEEKELTVADEVLNLPFGTYYLFANSFRRRIRHRKVPFNGSSHA